MTSESIAQYRYWFAYYLKGYPRAIASYMAYKKLHSSRHVVPMS